MQQVLTVKTLLRIKYLFEETSHALLKDLDNYLHNKAAPMIKEVIEETDKTVKSFTRSNT